VSPLQDEETVIESFGPFYTVISSNITYTIITDEDTLFVSITNYSFEVNRVVHMLKDIIKLPKISHGTLLINYVWPSWLWYLQMYNSLDVGAVSLVSIL